MRARLLLSVWLIGWLLLSCRHAIPANPARFETVQRPGYAYQRVDDGAVYVVASDHESLRQALLEIGCEREYVCLIQRQGEFYEVVQKRK